MTQEEKLEEAKRLYKTANADQKYVLERLFPELKESEDEKIRKEIVRFIQMEVEDEIVGNKWIAWLEKQKFTQKDVDDAWLKGMCDAKDELEKQSEQKETLCDKCRKEQPLKQK